MKSATFFISFDSSPLLPRSPNYSYCLSANRHLLVASSSFCADVMYGSPLIKASKQIKFPASLSLLPTNESEAAAAAAEVPLGKSPPLPFPSCSGYGGRKSAPRVLKLLIDRNTSSVPPEWTDERSLSVKGEAHKKGKTDGGLIWELKAAR